MSGELWCAVDYYGNSLSHASRNDKRLGTNPKKKKQVKIVREVQGPSLGEQDYAQAYRKAIQAGDKKKAKKIKEQFNKNYVADTGANSKGKATKNAKNAHQLSLTKTTQRQNMKSDFYLTGYKYKKGDQVIDPKWAKKNIKKKK